MIKGSLMQPDPNRIYFYPKTPEMLINLQVDVIRSAEGKQHIKCTRLESESPERYSTHSTEIDFIAHKWGTQLPGGIIPAIDQHHLLVIRLYWTPTDYRQKELVERVRLRLYKAIRNFMDKNAEWQTMLSERFAGDEWNFRDFLL